MFKTELYIEYGARFGMRWAQVDRALRMFPGEDPALACVQWKAQHDAKMKIKRRNLMVMQEMVDHPDVKIPEPTSTFVPECRKNPEAWFSNDPLIIEKAQEVCLRCPIRQQCLMGSLKRQERYGMWGGLDERRRILLMKEIRVGEEQAGLGEAAA